MIALREGAKELNHEHFHGGILEVAAKKKSDHFVSLAQRGVVICAHLAFRSTLPRWILRFRIECRWERRGSGEFHLHFVSSN